LFLIFIPVRDRLIGISDAGTLVSLMNDWGFIELLIGNVGQNGNLF